MVQHLLGLACLIVGIASFFRGTAVLVGECPPKFERFREDYGHPPPPPRKFGVGDGLQVVFGVIAAVGGNLLMYGPDG